MLVSQCSCSLEQQERPGPGSPEATCYSWALTQASQLTGCGAVVRKWCGPAYFVVAAAGTESPSTPGFADSASIYQEVRPTLCPLRARGMLQAAGL